MPPTILITRPERSAVEFADQLRARLGCGVPIVLSPLMRIEPVGQLPDLRCVKTLIFTSRHGVEAFANLTDRRDFGCYAVGDATAEAVRKIGMDARAGTGFGKDLARQIKNGQVETPCLHIRGQHAAVDIAKELNKAGIETDEAVLYRQIAQPLGPMAIRLLDGEDPVILPLFSPRSARLFFDQCKAGAPVMIAAISDNVARAVPERRAKTLQVAARPDANAMLDAVQDLYARAKPLEG